jgi:phosphatidylserine/phosphatidylglycerophosphate/cardiolipin synthase-like enzyme
MKKNFRADLRLAAAALAAAFAAGCLVPPAFAADEDSLKTQDMLGTVQLPAPIQLETSRKPKPTPAPAPRPAPAQSAGYTLLTQPASSNRDLIINYINGAQTSINLTIYEIEDPQIISALIAAAKRGVAVRVLYNHYSFVSYSHDPNAQYVTQLNAGGVQTKMAAQTFTVTHQKTFTFDGSVSIIMTFNLCPSYFATARDFGIVTSDPGQVAEITNVFEADWAYQPVSVSEPALVWSPDNSRTKILGIINGASKSLDVYNEETSDKASMAALIAAAKRGVTVRFITAVLTSAGSSADGNAAERAALNAGGVQAKGLNNPYIHAKMVLADYGEGGAQAFLGSENFSSTSLDKNRELGIILNDSGILSSIEQTFESDWGN